MNTNFSLVWNTSREALVVTSELARGRVKSANPRGSRGAVRARGTAETALGTIGMLGAAALGAALLATPAQAQNEYAAPDSATATGCSNQFAYGTPTNLSREDADAANPPTADGVLQYNSGPPACSTALGDNANAEQGGIAIGAYATATDGLSVALGPFATAGGNGSIALGAGARSDGVGAFAAMRQSSAPGTSAIAIGVTGYAEGDGAIAMGYSASAEGTRSVAIGSADQVEFVEGTEDQAFDPDSNTRADGARSVAIGAQARATGDDSVAFGTLSDAPGTRGISIGFNAAGADPDSISFGTNSFTNAPSAIAIGTDSQSTGIDGVALGRNSLADGASSVALAGGDVGANATADRAVAIGPAALAAGLDSVTIGSGASANLDNGVAVGSGAAVDGATNGLALGFGTLVDIDNSVALGANATTDVFEATPTGTIGGVTYTYAGGTPVGTVSIGSAGAERTLSNVAAGRVSDTSTDAVNGSQLFATNQAVERAFDEAAAAEVDYYSVNDGGTPQANVDNTGATAAGAIASGVAASATAGDAIAIGTGATAGTAASVALGSGATTDEVVATDGATIAGETYAYAGAAPIGTVSIGSAGAERTLTNVAAGRVSADSTDAVNGSQLFATNQAVESIDGRVTDIEGDVTDLGDEIDRVAATGVQYDVEPDGTIDTGTITLDGDDGTTLTNLADGDLSAGSTDAVNGGQLFAVQNRIDEVAQGGTDYFTANSTGPVAEAGGAEAVGIGPRSQASGDNSLAAGNGAVASTDGGVALGSGSQATREGLDGAEERFSNEAVASTRGAVSVGSEGGERQITNVAGGTQATDAVNVRQLDAVQAGAVNYQRNADGSVDYSTVVLGNGEGPTRMRNVAAGIVDTDAANVGQLRALGDRVDGRFDRVERRIDDVEDEAYAGAASAIAVASVPQAYLPGKSMISGGVANYEGESAIAVGVSRLTDNGRWAVKLNGTANTQDSFGVGGGVGFHW